MRKKVQVIKIDEHIYFVSNDEINYGDKVVSTIDHIVFTWQDIDVKDRTVSDKKVLATTNPDLWKQTRVRCSVCKASGYDKFPDRCSICGGSGVIIRQDGVAKIDTDFIAAYVREQGKIKEVELEYEAHYYFDLGNGKKQYTDNVTGYSDQKPKLRNNGEVIIHNVEPTIEDILEIIKDESEKSGVRQYTCINGFGYSQFERNIAERVFNLFKKSK